MIVLAWAVAVAAVVLASAGVLKILDPAPTTTMAAAIGVPLGDAGSRVVGVGETAAGLAVVITGAPGALLAMGGWYVVFAAGLVVLRARSPRTPCGCVGRWSGPPSARHVAVNALAAACAFAAALTGSGPPGGPTATAVFWSAVLVGALGVVAVLASPEGRRPGLR